MTTREDIKTRIVEINQQIEKLLPKEPLDNLKIKTGFDSHKYKKLKDELKSLLSELKNNQ